MKGDNYEDHMVYPFFSVFEQAEASFVDPSTAVPSSLPSFPSLIPMAEQAQYVLRGLSFHHPLPSLLLTSSKVCRAQDISWKSKLPRQEPSLYASVTLGETKRGTSVIKRNPSPEWNEDLILYAYLRFLRE